MLLKKEGILAQKTVVATTPSRRIWPLILISLPFFGVVAAFGIAPDTVPEPIALQKVVEDISVSLPLPEASDSDARFWREERIQRGDTIATVMTRIGVRDGDALSYILQAKDVRSLYQLNPGRSIRAITSSDGKLEALTYVNTDGRRLRIARSGTEFTASEEMPEAGTWMMQGAGEIETSLFAATDASGIPETVALQLVEIFSSDIDFHRDLRRGDRFSVVFEALSADGDFSGYGKVLAAEFVNQGRAFRAVFYSDDQGRSGYYTPEGRNMRRAFLRSPIEFSRVTSGFSLSRFHPILKSWRAHRGIDYGAPLGTRVRSTAEGWVTFVGQKNGYGNVVTVRHPNGYATLYGHLSAFAPGLKKGQRVTQAELLGFVGKSGLATGPHLHYEFHVNGVHQNPMRLAMPPGPPIAGNIQQAFLEHSRPLWSRLELLRNTELARLD
ncbi:MAG: peptidoglycan DD-metalloendopeptidase family protein [Burkholderiales bacterium]